MSLAIFASVIIDVDYDSCGPNPDDNTVEYVDIVLDIELGKDINAMIADRIRPDRLIAINSVKIDKKCRACREEQPGQLAHMEPGGCLYTK